MYVYYVSYLSKGKSLSDPETTARETKLFSMSELKIDVEPLNLKEAAPMKTYVDNLEIALTKSVRSSDDLSTYAAALLLKKPKVVGTDDNKATELTTTVDLEQVINRVVQQFREDMIAAVMANSGADHTVTELSHEMLPGHKLKVTYKLRGPGVSHADTVDRVLAALSADDYRVPVTLSAMDDTELRVTSDFEHMLIGTSTKWRAAEKRLHTYIDESLPASIKKQMREFVKTIRLTRPCRDVGTIVLNELYRRYGIDEADETTKVANFLTFCKSLRGQESLIDYLRRLQTIHMETAPVTVSNDMVYAHKARASFLAAAKSDPDASNAVAYARIVANIESSIRSKDYMQPHAIITALESTQKAMSSSASLTGTKRARGLLAQETPEVSSATVSSSGLEKTLGLIQQSLARLADKKIESKKQKPNPEQKKYAPPKGHGFDADVAVWCHKCWSNPKHPKRFNGYNEKSVTNILPHTGSNHNDICGTD